MSPRNWQDRIRDILDAIVEIQKFTHQMDFETFKKDIRSIRAVEMNFIIIGESANQIPEEVVENIPEFHGTSCVPCGRIVHVYFQVDENLLWDTVQNDLPPLIPMLEKLI